MTDRRGQVFECKAGTHTFVVLSSEEHHWDKAWHRVLILTSSLRSIKAGHVFRWSESWRDSWDDLHVRLG